MRESISLVSIVTLQCVLHPEQHSKLKRQQPEGEQQKVNSHKATLKCGGSKEVSQPRCSAGSGLLLKPPLQVFITNVTVSCQWRCSSSYIHRSHRHLQGWRKRWRLSFSSLVVPSKGTLAVAVVGNRLCSSQSTRARAGGKDSRTPDCLLQLTARLLTLDVDPCQLHVPSSINKCSSPHES